MSAGPVTLDAPTAHFDLLAIGAGPAGQKAAIQASKLGLSAAIVEGEQLGGCSVFSGTIPSKTLREAVLYLTGFSQRAIYGQSYRVKADITMEDLRTRAAGVSQRETDVIRDQLARNHVTVFDGVVPWKDKHYPLEFLCVPLLLWAAFRFEQREAATVVVLLSGIAIWGTLRGYGPFARPTFNESLLLLQAFQGVSAVMTLVLAAVVAERKEAEDRLRRLAVSDPLTGLANYRQLAQALDAEIKRSSRTDRPFAVVLMDLDGLKQINDRYGHLVGSLALRRVAETLLGSCRGMDTAARFGGDEFALVLPETADAAAWHVARRVADRVAGDGEQPPLSVSVGVAMHPRDGATLEALLNAADRSLYDTKSRRRTRVELSTR